MDLIQSDGDPLINGLGLGLTIKYSMGLGFILSIKLDLLVKEYI